MCTYPPYTPEDFNAVRPIDLFDWVSARLARADVCHVCGRREGRHNTCALRITLRMEARRDARREEAERKRRCQPDMSIAELDALLRLVDEAAAKRAAA